MVLAQSLCLSLRQREPGVEIDVLAPAWSAPILKRMPEVRRHVELPLAHGELSLRRRFRLGKQLRGEGYGQAIVIPRSFKAALVPLFARIPRRTGYQGEMRFGLLNDMRGLDQAVLRQTVQRYVALGLPADAPLPPACPPPRLSVDSEAARATARHFQLALEAPVLALCPGAEYGPAKRWPAESFAAVARERLAAGWRVWLFGSAQERALTEEIATLAPGCVNLAGRTTLEQAIDLLSLAHRVVSNDSGLMHVAAAVGCRLVAIYGSSDPAYTPPLSDRARVEYRGLACSPCFERTCRFGHYRCLREITPAQVITALAADAEGR